MNAGLSANELGISQERRDLIEALEVLGFDTITKDANWRFLFTDNLLRAKFIALQDKVEQQAEDAPAYPDIGDMLAVITQSEAALKAAALALAPFLFANVVQAADLVEAAQASIADLHAQIGAASGETHA